MHSRNRFTLIAGVLIAALIVLNVYQFFAAGQLGALSDEETVRRFHRLSLEKQFGYFFKVPRDQWMNPPGYTPNRWLGVQTLQNPPDAWVYQEIISEVRPDFIIETGTYHGGGAAFMALVLSQVNPAGRVITMDMRDSLNTIQDIPTARDLPIFKEKVEFLLGSSTDPKIVARVADQVKGKKVLVFLDSDHHRDHVLAEMKAYGPLVSVGSYLIVEDTDYDSPELRGPATAPAGAGAGAGPYAAVKDFLKTNDQFVPDRTRERFLSTTNPMGYLKRVK